MTNPPWEPPTNGTDAEHLAGSLDRLRYTFRWKVDGLTIEQLRQSIGSSALSLGALLKHLACCEDDVFSWRMVGQPPLMVTSCPPGVDLHEWMFTVREDETAEQLYQMWDEAVGRSREQLTGIVAQGRLDEPGNLEFEGVRPSLRRHLLDLIEEYGRHTGHADLIREAIDGRVGEDPPEDWRPGRG